MDKIELLTQNVCLGKRLIRVVSLVNSYRPDIFCLQEITGHSVADRIQSLTGYDYVISERVDTHFPLMFKHFYNVTFSRLPIKKTGNLLFKVWGKSKKKDFTTNILWTDIHLVSGSRVRVYNCHFTSRRLGMIERKEILLEVIKHADKTAGSVIICGDMNTMIPGLRKYRKLLKVFHKIPTPDPKVLGDYAYKDERHHFLDIAHKSGYEETADIKYSTWCIPFTGVQAFNVKLDWLLYKGLDKVNYRLGPWIGDHRSIYGEFQI